MIPPEGHIFEDADPIATAGHSSANPRYKLRKLNENEVQTHDTTLHIHLENSRSWKPNLEIVS